VKFTQKDEVFQDVETGVCYTKDYALYPIAVIDSSGKSSSSGILMTPYGDHPDVDWDGMAMYEAGPKLKKKFGFMPHQFGQKVLVTEAVFETRFKSLGVLTKEVDLDAVVRHYESECCDFSNRNAVSRSVARQLMRMVPAMWACELYTLLKDYLAHTPDAEKIDLTKPGKDY